MKVRIKRKKDIVDALNKVTVILALGEQWKEYYKSISTAKVVSLDNAVFPKKRQQQFPGCSLYHNNGSAFSKKRYI
ncbi:hypothetical protein ACT7DF_01615 [Bacillus cereus]